MAPKQLGGGCSAQIVRSHTVSKSQALKQIAEDGHVYGLSRDLGNLFQNNGRLVPALMGINQASTDNIFCEKHDNDIFAPLEKEPFNNTAEQLFLIAYRAIAREFYTKQSAVDLASHGIDIDRGRSPRDQVSIQSLMQASALGNQIGLRDATHYKKLFDEQMIERDFSEIRYHVIELGVLPDVMASGALFPLYDYGGRELQSIADPARIPDILCFSAFAANNRGFFAFIWQATKNAVPESFIASLPSDEQSGLPDVLVRFLFGHCENIYLRPQWWESLSPEKRRGMMNIVETMVDKTQPFDPYVLQREPNQLVAWNVID